MPGPPAEHQDNSARSSLSHRHTHLQGPHVSKLAGLGQKPMLAVERENGQEDPCPELVLGPGKAFWSAGSPFPRSWESVPVSRFAYHALPSRSSCPSSGQNVKREKKMNSGGETAGTGSGHLYMSF